MTARNLLKQVDGSVGWGEMGNWYVEGQIEEQVDERKERWMDG